MTTKTLIERVGPVDTDDDLLAGDPWLASRDWWGNKPFLTREDVARVLTEVRQHREEWRAARQRRRVRDKAPVTVGMVSGLIGFSKPGRRYADRPIPAPTYIDARRPIWLPAQGQAIEDVVRAWWQWDLARPGAGDPEHFHGGSA